MPIKVIIFAIIVFLFQLKQATVTHRALQLTSLLTNDVNNQYVIGAVRLNTWRWEGHRIFFSPQCE